VIQRGAWRRSSHSGKLCFEDDLIDFLGEISNLSRYKGARHIGVKPTQVRTEVDGDLVTIDFGAQWRGCNSDMTRTFVAGAGTYVANVISEMLADARLGVVDGA